MSAWKSGAWESADVSAEEADRLENLYGPLAQAVRALIDVTLRTDADEATVRAARSAIEEITGTLRPHGDDGDSRLRHADTGTPLLFANPVVGCRNPVAPPLVIHHDADGRCWSEFTLGKAYEGPPGLVHGGICALVLDHLLGEAATNGLREVRFTGTISLRFRRGTPLGRLRAEAFIDRCEEAKTYARGFISNADGPTVEAEGVFITPAWARGDD